MRIRPFGPDDYPAIVELHNALYPDTPRTVEDTIEADRRRGPQYRFRRWIAEADGRVVGMAQYAQYPLNYHPQAFDCAVRVWPAWQRRGIGSALYDGLMGALEPFDPIRLRAAGRENLPEGLRFLERRGFRETHRFAVSALDVTAFDPSPYAGLEAKLRAEGIVIKSLRELESDPERDRKLHDLEWALTQDVPGSEDLRQVPFEEWREASIHSPRALPDGYLVAVHGETYVGLSSLWASLGGDRLEVGLTGVRPAYRRRGIAAALKVRGIRFAQAGGYSVIKTDNEASNVPMLALNRRLGFVEGPAIITFEKVFREG